MIILLYRNTHNIIAFFHQRLLQCFLWICVLFMCLVSVLLILQQYCWLGYISYLSFSHYSRMLGCCSFFLLSWGQTASPASPRESMRLGIIPSRPSIRAVSTYHWRLANLIENKWAFLLGDLGNFTLSPILLLSDIFGYIPSSWNTFIWEEKNILKTI